MWILNRFILIVESLTALFAFVTSVIQTKRIIKSIQRYNNPSIVILGGGLIAAVAGTFVIMKKINKIYDKVK